MKAYFNRLFVLLTNGFVISCAIIFLITGAAKIYSAFGNAQVLQVDAPVLDISFERLFILVGAIEIAISMLCFCMKRQLINLIAVFWLSSNFLLYRLIVAWTGYHKPCSCLGSLTDSLHISAATGDALMKWILVYLLVGSIGCLVMAWLVRQSRVLFPES